MAEQSSSLPRRRSTRRLAVESGDRQLAHSIEQEDMYRASQHSDEEPEPDDDSDHDAYGEEEEEKGGQWKDALTADVMAKIEAQHALLGPAAPCRPLYVMDLEFHGLHGDERVVSQIAVQNPLNALDREFNKYIYWKRLHRDWQSLAARGVTLDKWNDPRYWTTFYDAMLELLDLYLPMDAVLAYKGTIDIGRLHFTLERTCTVAQQATIKARIEAKRIRVLHIDALWERICTELLPPAYHRVMVHKNMARALHKIYARLFWFPVLVFLPRVASDPETVVDCPLDAETETAIATKHVCPAQTQWTYTGHREPAWHKAEVDARFTCDILAFLLMWADFRPRLAKFLCGDPPLVPFTPHYTPDELILALLSTRVATYTTWFRTHRLVAPTSDWLHRTVAQLAVPFFDHGIKKTPDEAGKPDLALDRQKARDTRLAKPYTLVVPHRGAPVTVPVPPDAGRDDFKVRALKKLTEPLYPAPAPSVYDELEVLRALDAPGAVIGSRPWYFYGDAIQDSTITLHARDCVLRNHGQLAFDEAALKHNIHYVDFDRGVKPQGMALRFCRLCLVREGDDAERSDDETPGNPASPPPHNPNESALLALLFCLS